MEQPFEIVIVEDELDFAQLLEYHLQRAGYTTTHFDSCKRLEEFIYEENPSLLLLDRNLPGCEGSEFLQTLRGQGVMIPAIFLSAKDDFGAIDEAFLRGGDDYLVKPFRIEELLLRVGALLKRSYPHRFGQRKSYGKIEIEGQQVWIEGEAVELSALELRLLQFLLANQERLLSRELLSMELWQNEDIGSFNTLAVAISRLRSKIDFRPLGFDLKTVRGEGYCLSRLV